DGRVRFEIELIIHNQMAGEPWMSGNRNPIEQSQDRLAKLANLPRRASIGDVFDINRGRQALRTDMHDRIEPGNAAIGPVDDVPDGVYRKIHEHSMVCDIRQSGARDDLPPASDYGCAHVLFL